MKSKKPLLTISLLISNRPDTIPRCLDSIRPIMAAIPSELILIDTSKSEEIHELLLKYTDQVYEFDWCQDFAKARNEGVRRAKGEWFLYLDDDEWLVEIDELLEFFQTGKYKKFGSANIQVRNFLDPEYTKFEDGWVTRLFYLDGETRFEGRVHEYIYHLYGEQIFLQVIANHSGYIFETEEKVRQHFERNSKILLDVIKKEPDVLRWQAQMVQEYITVKEWNSIVSFCQENLENVKRIENFMDRNHFCTLYAGLIEGLMRLDRYEESIAVCEKAMKDERSTELLKALLYLRKAENYVSMEKWNEARVEIEKYLECYKAYDPNESAIQEQLGALVVQHTFEKSCVDKAYNILIYTELKKGNLDALEACENDLEWNQSAAEFNMKYIRFLVELMATEGYREVFRNIIANAGQDEALCNIVCAEAQKWEERDEEAFLRLAHIYAQVDSNFWYICYCRVVDADAQNDKVAVENALEELLCVLQNVFYLPDKVYDIIDKYDIKVVFMWEKIVEEKWQAQMHHFVTSCDMQYIDKVDSLLKEVYEMDDWRVVSLELAVMEKQLKAGPEAEVMNYYNLLKEYTQRKLVFYCNSCDNKESMEDVPADVQAVVKIKEYIELEVQDKMSALRKLKEAAEICPAFAEGLGKFLHRYSELENQREKKQKEEMNALRNQVIEQVRGMVKSGQEEVAIQIIQQLKQMFPGDLEVEQLALEIRLKTLE